jgi:hypothetical protein
MIALNPFHCNQIGEKQYWYPRQMKQTPMKPLYEYGSQVVGCCADGEDGYFHPILGRTHLLPITPGLEIARTPNNYTVIKQILTGLKEAKLQLEKCLFNHYSL